jgi:hypothetical protein
MWKKAFIRLTFILMLSSVALLVISASKTKISAPVEKCPNGKECCKSNNQSDNMMIWESVSRTILGSIQY